MMIAKFKDAALEEQLGLEKGTYGQVVANETRDGKAYMTVSFEKVEVNGCPADIFDIDEIPEPEDAGE